MRRFLLSLSLILLSFSSYAIQKSDNLNKTVELLRVELDALQHNRPVDVINYMHDRKKFLSELRVTGDKIDEYALVMYSQRNHSIFSMAYTCNRIQQVYNEFINKHYPFKGWKSTLDQEIFRYQLLQTALEDISPDMLARPARRAREAAIVTCDSIINMFAETKKLLLEDDQKFESVSDKIETLESYTLTQYEWLKKRIFLTGSVSYNTYIENLPTNFQLFKGSINQITTSYQKSKENSLLYQFLWLIGILLMILILAFLLTYSALRWVIPHKNLSENDKKKRTYYVVIFTLLLSILALVYCEIFLFKVEHLKHVTLLLIEFLITITVILFSIVSRLPYEKLFGSLMLYLPIMTVGILPILFRILVVDNAIVHFLYPPILMIVLVWYLIVLIKYAKIASRTDGFYSWFSFVILVACFVVLWSGFRFVSLQIVMLWITILTTLQSVIVLRHLLLSASHTVKNKTKSKVNNWYPHLINGLIMPLLSLIAILIGCLWAADVFDLAIFFKTIMKNNFLEIPKVLTLSVENILWLSAIGIVVNYSIIVTKEILRSIFGDTYESGGISVAVSIGTIVVWAIYIIGGMMLLNVDYSGIMVIMGGFSMGLGFAMKDTIDNFICGMSLMLGRVRVGDEIECDGIRGTVTSIGYRSTLIETLDGSVIAFLNNQLFAKTFKNLTRNHGYELAKIPVGVAYGTDVEQARQLVIESVHHIPTLQKGKPVSVLLDQFGANSIDLIVVVWVPVRNKGSVLSSIKEAIYNAFNENGITIPFPQQDVYIHKLP